ncbi:MAG: mechanosensitive ion channel family protein [Candidatus Bipolaricaulota bacterium]|nr:mechanosensitive ion channel family protein [Candidatus Bipolaricaulota bacterium]
MEFLHTTFYGNPVWRWLAAVGVILLTWLALQVFTRVMIRHLRKLAERTEGQLDDLLVELLHKTRFFLVFIISAYAGSRFLALPATALQVLHVAFVIALLAQAGYWGNGLVTFWLTRTVKRRLGDDASTATSLAALGFLAKLVLWAIILLLALDNMGVNVNTLIAGLGITGIAVALGVQSIFKDLFASLSIIVDKPFVIGDFIAVGDLSGTVEKVGLKTTRVRSLSGEQIIFSNGDLLDSRLRNYMRMTERRIAFPFGLAYDTPTAELAQVPSMVKAEVENVPGVRFDRCHLKSFADSVLTYETVYFVLTGDYVEYMNAQQAINLGILRAFEEKGIRLAHPTRTLYVRDDGEKPWGREGQAKSR